jgi:hypothetical protein
VLILQVNCNQETNITFNIGAQEQTEKQTDLFLFLQTKCTETQSQLVTPHMGQRAHKRHRGESDGVYCTKQQSVTSHGTIAISAAHRFRTS